MLLLWWHRGDTEFVYDDISGVIAYNVILLHQVVFLWCIYRCYIFELNILYTVVLISAFCILIQEYKQQNIFWMWLCLPSCNRHIALDIFSRRYNSTINTLKKIKKIATFAPVHIHCSTYREVYIQWLKEKKKQENAVASLALSQMLIDNSWVMRDFIGWGSRRYH